MQTVTIYTKSQDFGNILKIEGRLVAAGRGRQRDGECRPPLDNPTTGRELFAWCKEVERQRPEAAGLLKHLNTWARARQLPARMVDWYNGQVLPVYHEAHRWLEARTAERTAETTGVPS